MKVAADESEFSHVVSELTLHKPELISMRTMDGEVVKLRLASVWSFVKAKDISSCGEKGLAIPEMLDMPETPAT
jgi:hypothetical protein